MPSVTSRAAAAQSLSQEEVDIVGSAVGLHAGDAAAGFGLSEAEVHEAGEDFARKVGMLGTPQSTEGAVAAGDDAALVGVGCA